MTMPATPQEVTDWVKAVAPVFGPVGIVLGWIVGRKQRRKAAEHEGAVQEAAQTDAVTRRFEALMDGYEHRIGDLVSELERMRTQIEQLQHQLESRGFGQ